ncbi:cyclic nucleotide-gated ion channel 1-like protein [Anopheles sinensis]|uniref:Cyclic nucleotide-gated ion channel 1-like protein n=1 Tax=Anopheles sinensis TaxID=74873 RepID=A0A084WKQ7_ANOSI|nr:cyclic nucleotide-gated ion channel 1-like protein [Anopheles sinensis]
MFVEQQLLTKSSPFPEITATWLQFRFGALLQSTIRAREWERHRSASEFGDILCWMVACRADDEQDFSKESTERNVACLHMVTWPVDVLGTPFGP